MSDRPASDRVRVRRQPTRGRYELADVYEVLDRSRFAHVAFVHEEQPFCVPMLQARIDARVYVHGSSASRALRALAEGIPACLTVTTLHGLVLARSAFEHSANYESAMVLGSFRRVDDESERLAAFEAFTNKLIPGRWDEVRPPNAKELKATSILGMEIAEASVKARTGPPSDDDSADADEIATWAGVVPFEASFGAAVPSPGLRPGIDLAESVRLLLDSESA
jgi:uncharacterized protein